MDEAYQVGKRLGSGGGRPGASTKASLILGAIEVQQDRAGFGRVRLATAPSVGVSSLRRFAQRTIDPLSLVISDGWPCYPRALEGYQHQPINVSRSGLRAHEVQPGIHRVFSLLDRMLKGTYQGAVRAKHMLSYVEEFAFRFNRRRSKSRALLFQRVLSAAAMRPPPTHRQIVHREPFTLPERS